MTSYLKALTGALIAGLGSLYQALDNGAVTAQEWVTVAITTLAALGTVWGIPNLDPRGKRQAESVQPPDQRGAVDAAYVLLVAILAVVLLVLVFRFAR